MGKVTCIPAEFTTELHRARAVNRVNMTVHDRREEPETSGDDAAGWLAAVAAAQGTKPEHGHRAQGIYVHVPYCATRCGYCDFNTYTPRETDVEVGTYVAAALAEIDAAGRWWKPGQVDTVFIGGGTPTLLSPRDLELLLHRVDDVFGLAAGAEISVEINPDSVDAAALRQLRASGFTRASIGVQSLATHVLAVLERTHSPGRSLQAIDEALAAGFEHVSADIMYATPGETDDDLAHTMTAILERGVDHISAYSLIVEPGTRLAAQVRRGEVPEPDDDVSADRYVIVDQLAQQYGLEWYEVSSWARPGGQCQHNLGYWRNQDWWAIGPGAHGHISGVRWVNAKHPRAYAERIHASGHAMIDWEQVTPTAAHLEEVMLGLRLRTGLPEELITAERRPAIAAEIAAGYLIRRSHRLVLTETGRHFSDAIARRLTP